MNEDIEIIDDILGEDIIKSNTEFVNDVTQVSALEAVDEIHALATAQSELC